MKVKGSGQYLCAEQRPDLLSAEIFIETVKFLDQPDQFFHILFAELCENLRPEIVVTLHGLLRGGLSLGSCADRDFAPVFRIDLPGDLILLFQRIQDI